MDRDTPPGRLWWLFRRRLRQLYPQLRCAAGEQGLHDDDGDGDEGEEGQLPTQEGNDASSLAGQASEGQAQEQNVPTVLT
jgi:hypothetical protein